MTDSPTPRTYLRPDAAEALLTLVMRSLDEYRSPTFRKAHQEALPFPEVPKGRELRSHESVSNYARAMIGKYGQVGVNCVSVMENEHYKLILSLDPETGRVSFSDELFNKEEYSSALQIVVKKDDSIVMYSMLPEVGGETAWRYRASNLERFMSK